METKNMKSVLLVFDESAELDFIDSNLCENGFLKQPYHSIIPFILMQNKEIHRMCLSDYELKLFYCFDFHIF